MRFAHVYAWTYRNLSHACRRTARRHHPNPAEAHRRWRGERSKPIRLGVRDHTHALFAGKVQRKVRNGVADLAASASSLHRPFAASGDHLWIAEIAPIRVRTLAMQLHDDVRVLHPGIRERTPSSLDVSQFESDHPGKLNSTAVMLRVWQYLAAAAYSSSHSSNAKSLCGAFSADSPKIEAPRARLRS